MRRAYHPDRIWKLSEHILPATGRFLPPPTIKAGTKVELPNKVESGPRKRILVVEDDVDLARLYCGVLRLSGFDARYVSDGWSALRALESTLPDLIVLDIHLPGLRGPELLAELGQRAETQHIPAIVVTGTDIELAVAQAKQILRKPCPPERLLSAVERYVKTAA